MQQMTLNGLKVIVSPHIPIERKRVRLTWKERLFSWPWRPWVSHRIEIHTQVVLLDGTLFVHPRDLISLTTSFSPGRMCPGR